MFGVVNACVYIFYDWGSPSSCRHKQPVLHTSVTAVSSKIVPMMVQLYLLQHWLIVRVLLTIFMAKLFTRQWNCIQH